MEIHFYESKNVYPDNVEILHDWESVRYALDHKVPEVHTTQMCELAISWTFKGYRLFVHQGNGITYEVKRRMPGDYSYDDRTVRPSQNAYAMWASNVFRMVSENEVEGL